MKHFKRIYLEITDVCNLACGFCHGTRRPPRFLAEAEFRLLTEKLRGHTDYLYFHLMGEPLLHPALGDFLRIAAEAGFRVNLTTNAFLLPRAQETLLAAPKLHRVNLSLQSWEANPGRLSAETYIAACADFAEKAAAQGTIVSLRLWNGGGENTQNPILLGLLEAAFPPPWRVAQKNTQLAPNVFLEFGDRFDWPDADAAETGTAFCHGLRDHIGVLCDGTVVPCCLDAEGTLALGNLLESDLETILSGPRATAIFEGFSRRTPAEALCRRCGFASKF